MPDRSPFRWLMALLAALVLASPAAAQSRAPDRPPRVIPGEIIVKFRPGAAAEARASVRASLGAHRKLRDFDFIRAEHIKLEGNLSVEQAIERLSRNPNVEYAEPNYEVRALLTPNDPRYPELYAMRNTGQTGGTPGADIRASNAWDLFTGDPNLLVGVIDTGVDYNHPDLAANAWTNPGEIPGNSVDDDNNGFVDDVHGYDFVNNDGDPFDDNGHGTHVSGTIGGVGNNGIGVVGVNWNVKIAGIKFLSAGGSGSTANAILSVEYAITIGCRLTSNSWGGGGFSQALLDAINAAGAAGQLFVAAAGNAGSNTDVSPAYPASYDSPYIISVAATDHNDGLASFSNFGLTTVDLGAPGVDILSCEPGGNYQLLSGTSMATPHVAGACALAWGRFPGASNLQIKQLIMVKADPIPALAGRCVTGARLNVFLAIADPDSTPPGQVVDLATVDPGSTTMGLTWTATGDDAGTGRASRYDIRWATSAITDSVSFYAANAVEGPDPQTAGSTETFEIPGLTYSTLYYFALRALDEFGNAGPISNVPTGTTLGIPNISITPPSLAQTLLTGAQATHQLTVSNTGAGRLDWTGPTPELVFELGRAALVEETPRIPEMALGKGETDPRPGILGRGGPDGFGYRWVDSDEPGGPAFGWVDITGVGTQLALSGDDAISPVQNIGFSFPFYGNTFSTLQVCTNGFLSFSDSGTPYSNAPLPGSSGVANMVAPFWDDLDFGATPRVYVHNDGARFIVSWVGAPHYQTGGPYTFQAILYPSGEIRYQYLTLGSPTNSATAGIQNQAENVGLTVAYNAAYFHDNLAVQIAPLRQWLTVTPTSGRLHAGNSQLLDVTFDASALNGGIYDGFVKLLSNDPDGSPSSTPCQLTVIGAPNIVATPGNTDFGTQFTGGTYDETLVVSNNGTDILNVFAIGVSGSCTGGALTALPAAFALAPGAAQNVTLSWLPPSPCTLAASIEIVSDDPDSPTVTVTAAGEAVPAPSFSVDPRSFEETLPTNTAVSRSMRIENHGGSPLTYSAQTMVVSAASDIGTAAWRHVDGDAENVLVEKGAADSRFGPAPLAAGGPDAFGYRWSDSNESGGPAFSWVDISGIGTAIPFNGDDQNQGPFPIGFSFPYYGATFSDFRACTNGWISFTSSSTAYSNTTLPNSGSGVPENLVAAFWDDLTFSATGDAYYHSDGSRLIVQWQAVPRLSDGGNPNTFQIQLYPDGRIIYQYLSITAAARNSHTIGIQDAARNDGLQVVFNNESYIQDNLAVRFSPPARFLTVTPLSGSVPAGDYVELTVGFNAAGLFGGDYEAAVRLTTNDPILSQYDVPAILHVIGVPDIAAAPDPVNFGDVFIGYPQLRQITVSNTGTDALVVDDVTSSDPAYTPNTTAFTIPPLGQAIVNVNFNPVAVQAYPATLTIKSNDPDTQFLGVDLQGEGIVAPDVTSGPGSMTQTLPQDATASQTLVIQNNGGSDLVWTLGASVDAASPSFVIHPGLDLKKGEVDPREGIVSSGGPDAFGYRWKDSDESGGPAFAWADITGAGTPIDGFSADDRLKTGIPIGFSFPFYGNSFTTVNVCTNGWLSFTWPDSSFTNDPLPSAGARTPANLVAPFWDDLDLRNAGAVYYHNDGTRFIVSWGGVPHYIADPGDPTYTFQAILYPSGRVLYQYLSMNDILDSATLGIQNANRDIGLQVVFNAAYVHDNLAVEISRTPEWLSTIPEGGTIPAGESRNISVGFDSENLELGSYDGNLRLSSNDPDEGVIDIPVQLIVSDLVAVDDPGLPRFYGLRLAGANPVRGNARLELAMPQAGTANVRIHDVRGALVRSVVDGPVPAGTHTLLWDGKDAAGRKMGAGVYFVSARTAAGMFRKELVLLP